MEGRGLFTYWLLCTEGKRWMREGKSRTPVPMSPPDWTSQLRQITHTALLINHQRHIDVSISPHLSAHQPPSIKPGSPGVLI